MATKQQQKSQPTAPPRGDAAVETSVRTFTLWTPERIRSAERSAESGYLREAAAICDWLLSDDRIRGVLSSRLQGLLGMVPSFEKSGDRRRSGRAIKALEADDDWWVSYPESESMLILSWGLLLGVAPARNAWKEFSDHGNRVLPCPNFWHPSNLRFDWQQRQWLMKVQAGVQAGGFTEQIIRPGEDPAWLLHMPFGATRPWQMGLWRGLAWWKLLKDYARSDWAQHSEKASLLVATTTGAQSGVTGPASSKQYRDDLARSIYDRGREAVAVLPPNFDLKLVESVANTNSLYKSQIDMANEAFAVTIRGGNLTTVTEGGSKAAAEVQERTGDFVNLRFDAETWSTTLNAQSLPWWAEFNFGDSSLAPWPNYPVAPQRNLLNYAGTITAAMNALDRAEQIGIEVDRDAFLEEFELQEFFKAGKRPAVMVKVKPPGPMRGLEDGESDPADAKPAGEGEPGQGDPNADPEGAPVPEPGNAN